MTRPHAVREKNHNRPTHSAKPHLLLFCITVLYHRSLSAAKHAFSVRLHCTAQSVQLSAA